MQSRFERSKVNITYPQFPINSGHLAETVIILRGVSDIYSTLIEIIRAEMFGGKKLFIIVQYHLTAETTASKMAIK